MNTILFKCKNCRRQHTIETINGKKPGLTYKIEYAPKHLREEILSKFPNVCSKCGYTMRIYESSFDSKAKRLYSR